MKHYYVIFKGGAKEVSTLARAKKLAYEKAHETGTTVVVREMAYGQRVVFTVEACGQDAELAG